MNKQFWANTALCVCLGVAAVIGVVQVSSALTPKGLFVKDRALPPAKARLLRQVVLESVDAGRMDVGKNMVRANFELRNGSARDVKNFNVVCDFYDGKGNYIEEELWLLPDMLPAGQAARFSSESNRFLSRRAVGLRDCRITDFEVVQEPFFKLDRVVESGHHEAAGGHEGHQQKHGEH